MDKSYTPRLEHKNPDTPGCSHVQGFQSVHYAYGYGLQIAGQYNQDIIYVRQISATTYRSWRKIWDSATLTSVSQLSNDSGYITSSGTSAACSGNAASATTSGQVTVATGRTDAAWYNVVWNSGNYLYSPNTVQIRSSGYGAIGFNGSAWYFEGNASYGIYSNTGLYAAGGLWDAGNRVYSAGNPQGSVSGSSGSCTGNAATATRAGGTPVFWSSSHPVDYYLVNNWTGTHWQITSNHGAGVRVAYADTAGSAPASDVYSWAKAATPPASSTPFAAFGTLTAVLFH